MIIKNGEYLVEIIKNMKGGIGEFYIEHLVDEKMLGNAGRLFARGTLQPGHSVGWHIHAEDMELCYILKGTGIIIDNDKKQYNITQGDMHICLPGDGHEIINNNDRPLVYMAIVLYPNCNKENTIT